VIKKAKSDEICLIFEELDAVESVKKRSILEVIIPLKMQLFTFENFTTYAPHENSRDSWYLMGMSKIHFCTQTYHHL
jgi:hypothetical protein